MVYFQKRGGMKKTVTVWLLTQLIASVSAYCILYQTTYTETGTIPSINLNDTANTKNPLGIIEAQYLDSLGTENWKNYLESEKLFTAWAANGTFSKYQKLKLLTTIKNYKDKILPRYSQGENNSVIGLRKLIEEGVIDTHTMVILDSGGAHSVAMAVELVKKINAQPILMFDCESIWPLGSNKHAIQVLATLLYFSAEEEMLKNQKLLDGPVVFVLDTHRDSSPLPGEIDNSYRINPEDLPSPQELINHEIRKVVIITEGNSKDWVSYSQVVDLGERIFEYNKAGIEIQRFGIEPWPKSENFLFPFPWGSAGK